MVNFESDFHKYVSRVFKSRLKELGISANRFIYDNADYANRPTLQRILAGRGSSNINTVAHYAGLLGLEFVLRDKENGKDYEIKD